MRQRSEGLVPWNPRPIFVFSTQTHSYTLIYAGQDAVYDKHFPSFQSLMQTVRLK